MLKKIFPLQIIMQNYNLKYPNVLHSNAQQIKIKKKNHSKKSLYSDE